MASRVYFPKGTEEFIVDAYVYTDEGRGMAMKARIDKKVKFSVISRKMAKFLQLPCLENETYQ